MIGPLHSIYRAATWTAIVAGAVTAAIFYTNIRARHPHWPHSLVWLLALDAAALLVRRVTGRMCRSAIQAQGDYRWVSRFTPGTSDRQRKQLTKIYQKYR